MNGFSATDHADWRLAQLLPAARIELAEGHYIEAFSVTAQLLSTLAHQSSPGPWLWSGEDQDTQSHTETLQQHGEGYTLVVSQHTGSNQSCPSDGALISFLSTPEVAYATAAMFAAAALDLDRDRRAVVRTLPSQERIVEDQEQQETVLLRSVLAQQALPLLRALLRGER